MEDPVISTLKQRFFAVVAKEDYPNTPEITQEADHLQEAIRKLQTVELKK